MVEQGRRARARGRPTSLGRCYADGKGVEQNHTLAATWVSKAAAQGHVEAQGYLGFLCQDGEGVEQDDALAVAWWEKASVGDHAPSQCNLGLGYMHGHFGLTKNAHCAKIYMMAAAEQGHARATREGIKSRNVDRLILDTQALAID